MDAAKSPQFQHAGLTDQKKEERRTAGAAALSQLASTGQEGGEPLADFHSTLSPNLSRPPNGLAAIYVESIRDAEFGLRDNPIQRDRFASSNQGVLNQYRSLYSGWIYGVMAHEVGHAPGHHAGGTDHNEGGLMIFGAADITGARFADKSILRFRKTSSWTGQ